jgi:hypothetical protein
MRPLARLGFAIGLAGAAALVSGCDKISLDPDKLDFSLFDTKQKLPGERKDVFPGGVPGVTPGVPPEMVKGYHEPADAPPEQKAADAKPRPQPRSKPAAGEQTEADATPKPAPKPHVVQRPKPQPEQTASVQGTAPAATGSTAAPAAQPPGSQPLPWPGQAQQQAQPQAGWPAPSPGR